MSGSRATSFGAWADEYERWRPTYPAAAVDWLLPPGAVHVLEVGAGTGKLTDKLVGRGLEVEVVEPDGRMLDVLRRRHTGLRAHEAGAADLPLGNASVDAVLVADAWHWFPKEEAAAEVTRVLRPGGWLGVVRYDPRPEHAWQWRALGLDPALAPPDDLDPLERLGLRSGRAEQRVLEWSWPLTPAQWRGFVSTVSHVRLLPDDERAAVLAETESLATQASESTGTPTVPLRHDTVCIRWRPEL